MRIRVGRSGLKAAAVGLLVFATLPRINAQSTPSGAGWPADQPQVYRTTGSRVAIGRNIQIPQDEEVSDAVVVIGGSLRIDGRVRDGVVVIGGNVELGSRADVRGDVVLVGGRLSREPGSQLRGSVSDVSFGDWSSWSIGGLSLPIVDFGDWGRWLSLFGAMFRVSLLAVLMAFILIVARAPVARVGRAAANEPVRSFLVGLAAEIFFIPLLVAVTIGLIMTIIGIPLLALLVPLALFMAFVALMLGFTGVACRIGEWVEDRLGWRSSSAFVATAIGLLLILGPGMISRLLGVAPAPLRWTGFTLLAAAVIFEFVIWTIGFGAALLTGFGRWSTAPPPIPPVAQPGVVQLAN